MNNAHSPEVAADSIELLRIYHLLLNKAWLIGVIVVAVSIATWAFLARQPKLYTSKAVIQVEQAEKNIVSIEEVDQQNLQSADYLNTLIQSITSRPVLLRVVESMKLTEDPSYVQSRPGKQPSADRVAGLLDGRIEVKLRKGTRLIDISADDTNPVRAQKLVQAVVKEFLRESFEQKLAVSRVANEFLQEEAQKLKDKLETSERKLQSYREQHNAVSLEDRQNITVEKLREINSRSTEAKSQRVRLEADLEQVQRVDPKNVDQLLAIGSVSELPQVAGLRDQLVAAEAELAVLKERYLAKHPKHIAAASKITNLRASLQSATAKAGDLLNQQYEAAKQNESKLEEALREQEKAALQLDEIGIPYGVLQREVESDRALYESVIKRLRETTVMQGVDQAPFRVVEAPMIPSRPSKPKVLLLVSLAALLAAFLSIAGIVTKDVVDSSLRSVDDAESFLGLASLAAVPDLERYRHRVMSELKEVVQERRLPDCGVLLNHKRPESEHPIVLLSAPNSPSAEAFRTFRASVALLGPDKDRRSFLFTSAVPAEGKSFTSLNAAVVFAQMGLRTVIIDADLRRPKLHQDLLNVVQSPTGLSDILCEKAAWDKVIRPTEIENLSVIPAGSRCPNPAELLSNADFQGLVDKLLAKFDRVVVDTAPINAVSDTLLLARATQCVVLVVRAGGPPRKAVRRAVQLLAKAEARFGGFVMNRLPPGRGSGYYYYYYGGDYSKDSVYGAENSKEPIIR